MRVGISILTQAGHNVWNSGIGQNVYHLASLLEAIPFVEQVVLVDTGDQGLPPNDSGALGRKFAIVPLRDASDVVDVVIEVSGGLDGEWTRRFRARGGRVVFHVCGQPYSGFVEHTIFDRPTFFGEAERCDEIWLLEKDKPFEPMLRALHRCPVHQTPYLWAPVFLQDTVELIALEGLQFGYAPGALLAHPVRVGIFEPNISPIKIGLIPFLICEEVERSSPEVLDKVYFMNTIHMAKQRSFVDLVGNSQLYRKEKVSLEAREYMARVVSRGANMVISHQINCPQNYLYLDVLMGDYPLVHNSAIFKDVGYYYPASDIEAGVAQVRLAQREHDHNLDAYKARSAAMIRSVDPLQRANIDVYARRLLALSPATARSRATAGSRAS